MGFYGNKSLHCFLVTWIQLLSSAGWLRLVRTTNFKTGHVNKWPSDIKRPKTALSGHIKGFHFWICIPWRSMQHKYTCMEHWWPHLVPTSKDLSPHPRPPCFFIPYTSSPSPSGRQIWDLFSHILGCLVNKLLLCCKPQYFRVWLAVHLTNESGSVIVLYNATFGEKIYQCIYKQRHMQNESALGIIL